MTDTVTLTCTGCALLCEDIQVLFNNGHIEKIEHACIRGRARILGCKQRTRPTVDHKPVDIQEAVSRASEILKEADNPLLFGWSNSTSEAQRAGIRLARTLRTVIDSTSSFCQGIIINELLKGYLPTCTLEDVREKADVMIYWGADPMSSHPRHLSKYSYFPRGELRQRGYEEDRTAICVDVWQSRTAKICKNRFYRIPPGGDGEFMRGLMDAVAGRVPKIPEGYDVKQILELAGVMKRSRHGVIFAGLGLVYSMKTEIELLVQFLSKLNEVSNYSLIPMAGHFNMRGFNHNLFEETGFVHRVKFTDTGVVSGVEYSVMEQLKNGADAVLIVGSDPLTSFPGSIARRLRDIPVILIDPCQNLTSKLADVTIPCSISGIENGGTAVRMDGVEMEFSALMESEQMSDEQIIRSIMEEMG